MNKITTILFLIFSSILYGQRIDSTKIKQIEMYEKIMYEMNSNVFKKQKLYSKLDKDFKLPWKAEKVNTIKQFENALDTLIQKAKIEISDSFYSLALTFQSSFPTYIEEELFDIFKLTIKSYDFTTLNIKPIKLQKTGSVTYGSYVSSGFKENGELYHSEWKTINMTFNIHSEKKVKKEDLKGSFLFNSGFVTDYDFIKIDKSSIGKSLFIGDIEFTVIDIIENKIILDFKQDLKDIKFDFVNLDNKGSKISQIPYFDFEKLKKEGKIPSGTLPQATGSQTINKIEFDLFKLKPDLSFTDYKIFAHPKFVEILNSENQKETADKIWGKKYLLFFSADKIQNFYLYKPKYIEKEFEMEIK